ncbi:MAG: putative RDD family membrane protein YckC [Limisphaerales bacterium]|jgi:uncharacterized RDD family membrane protein YckC
MEDILDSSEQRVLVNAGFGERFLAFLIDLIIMAIVGVGISYAMGEGSGFSFEQPEAGAGPFDAIFEAYTKSTFFIGLIVWMTYFSFFDSSSSQGTLGKQALGIKVVDDNGNKLSMGISITRNLVKVILHNLIIVGWLSWLTSLGESKQTPHDMVAKTYVVKR